ncbi:hypothetical protein, conserved [Eimeria tenella]|uniref:Uncharacterized protein n=1 Tax=Eimeria tenella TaxID=5802 RepID=U6KRX3_EIMTE|nr:hypothetical protein, conserved [Eimeria tenella]CDJ40721.1 hypothetical protein, conserved [Eimeria tenella]|eukprot:XP_013231471.1 hypothetical protein, conserved [Eimeria tenella]
MGLFWSPPNMFFIAEVYAACLAGLWVGANGAASPLWKDSSFNFAPDQAYPSTQVNDVPLTDFVVSDLYEVKEHHRRSIGGLLGRIIVAAVIAAIAFVLLRCFISLKQKPSDWTSRHLAEGKLDVECQEYSYTIMRIDAPTPKLKKTEKSEHSIATKEVLQELRTKYYAPVSTRSQKIVSHGLCFQFDITEVGPVAEKDLPTAVTPRGEGHALRVSRASLVQQEEELAPQAIQNEPKEQEDEKPGSDKGADPFAESSDSEASHEPSPESCCIQLLLLGHLRSAI